MAIYILQPMIDRVLGSRGGVTFQRCGQQFSIRNRAKPVLKKTEASQAVRARFGSIQSRWRSLSSGDQTTFEDAIPNYPRVDSLGNPYEIKAINLFGSSNINLVAQGLSQIDTIPISGSFPANGYVVGNFDVSASTWQVTFIPNPVPAGYSFTLIAGPTQSDNNSSPSRANMKTIKTWMPGQTTAVNVASEYIQAFNFNELSPGRFIPVGRVLTELATGQQSVSIVLHALIVP